MSTTYEVEITHDDDGDLAVRVSGCGSTEKDRESVAWALRKAAELVEQGRPLDSTMYS